MTASRKYALCMRFIFSTWMLGLLLSVPATPAFALQPPPTERETNVSEHFKNLHALEKECTFNAKDIVKPISLSFEDYKKIMYELGPSVSESTPYGLGRSVELQIEAAGDPDATFTPGWVIRSASGGSQGRTGIGLLRRKNSIEVMHVVPGSPAEKSGIRPGDTILAVNGKDVSGFSELHVETLLKGKTNESLSIDIGRNGRKRSVFVTRKPVSLYEVEMTWKEKTLNIKSRKLGSSTVADLRNYLIAAGVEKADGIILDLRDNSGGLEKAMETTAGLFLPRDSVYARYRYIDGYTCVRRTSLEPVVPADMPLVVIVNRSTMAGAEFMAAALQKRPHTIVLGDNTLGLTRLEEVVTYGDASILRVRVATILTAEGRDITGGGVRPGVRVASKKSRGDSQLARALAEVKKLRQ